MTPDPQIERHYAHKVLRSDGYGGKLVAVEWVDDPEDGNLVSSLVGGFQHAPVLDLDFPARLVPSSTPGHFHLYLERLVSWPEYKKLLKALAAADIIEKEYAKESIRQGATFVRREGIYKPGAIPPALREDGETAALLQRNAELEAENARLRDRVAQSETLTW